MSTQPGPLYRPYDKLVTIQVNGKDVQVPDQNMLLRCFQFLAPENVAYGRFCWNEDCQYCRVVYDMGDGSPKRQALSCKLMVKEGMRVVEIATEIRYCLRDVLKQP